MKVCKNDQSGGDKTIFALLLFSYNANSLSSLSIFKLNEKNIVSLEFIECCNFLSDRTMRD